MEAPICHPGRTYETHPAATTDPGHPWPNQETGGMPAKLTSRVNGMSSPCARKRVVSSQEGKKKYMLHISIHLSITIYMYIYHICALCNKKKKTMYIYIYYK